MNELRCLQCGTPASPGAKFCENCGTQLSGSTSPIQQSPPPQPTAPTTVPPASQPQYGPDTTPGFPPSREGTEYQLWIQRGRMTTTTCNIVMLIGFFVFTVFLCPYVYYRAGKGVLGIGAAIGLFFAALTSIFIPFVILIVVYAGVWYYIYKIVKGYQERFSREYGAGTSYQTTPMPR